MKSFLFITMILFLACGNSQKSKKVNESKESSRIAEDFSTFFEKFTSNNNFRVERTIVPFRYKMTDEEDKEIVKQIGKFPIELDKKKWKEKVIFEFSDKTKDSVILSISIEDTGYLIQVKFSRKENNNWYAIEAENLSD